MAIENTHLNGNGIQLGSSGFDLQAPAPLDTRQTVPAYDGLQALIDGGAAYEGMIVYDEETKKTYQAQPIDGVLTFKEFGINEEELKNLIASETTAAMEFKGVTASLPTSGDKGDMYKVSTGFTVESYVDAQGSGFTTKNGDSIVCNGEGKWFLIPSGDDIEDTWRPVADVDNDSTLTFADGDKLDVVVTPNGTVTYKHETIEAPVDNTSTGDEKTRTYITAVETDGFGHITGYKTATENVEDTNTTYTFEGQSDEPTSVYFQVASNEEGSDTEVVYLDAYSRNDADNKFKTKQIVVNDPTSNGNSVEFIDTISQNENGEITATKKSVNFSNVNDELNKKLESVVIETGDTNGQVKYSIDGAEFTNVDVKGLGGAAYKDIDYFDETYLKKTEFETANASVVNYKDIIQSHNYFGGKKLYISRLDDVLYAADKRFNVSAANYSSSGNLNRNHSAAEIEYLFDGKCEDPNFSIAAGTYSVINITIPDGNYRELGQLPYGSILLNFYADNTPQNVSMRVYCDYQNQGIGWHDLIVNDYVNNGVDQLIKIARNDYYNISQIEITVTAKDNIAATVSSIEMILDRPGSINPVVSKYKPETLYYDLTAPNFIGTASKAKADSNGNDIADTYIKYRDILQTTNPFGGKKLYISKIDDAFYAAGHRFNVSCTSYNADGSVYWECEPDEYGKLFNGRYEDFVAVIPDKYTVIRINFTNYDDLSNYPYGNILMSFYYENIPAEVTARAYCNYEPLGIGWHDLPVFDLVNEGTKNVVKRIRNDLYQVSEFEITVRPKSDKMAYITTLEMSLDRPDSDKTPMVSKFVPETLYYDLTAPNFIGNLTGTASNHYTKEEIDNMELITVDDIDEICGASIVSSSEVTF